MTLSVLVDVLLLLLVCVAVVTALLRDVLAATVAFTGYSLGMAILWVVLQAPDVGLTEAAVGAGVMTSLFLVVIGRTTRSTESPPLTDTPRPRSVLAAAGVLVGIGLTIPSLPAVGTTGSTPSESASSFYLGNAVGDFGVENVVTAVLAGYRGLDTFGEVGVIFAAGVAVLVVFQEEVF